MNEQQLTFLGVNLYCHRHPAYHADRLPSSCLVCQAIHKAVEEVDAANEALSYTVLREDKK